MSSDTITNFIETIDTVTQWAVTKLDADEYWKKIYRIPNYDLGRIYELLAEAEIPTCIVIYKGGTYQNQPRAKRTFSVFVAEQALFDKDDAVKKISGAINKVLSLLDHEVASNQALVRAKSENNVSIEGSGITAYEIEFEIEDY